MNIKRSISNIHNISIFSIEETDFIDKALEKFFNRNTINEVVIFVGDDLLNLKIVYSYSLRENKDLNISSNDINKNLWEISRNLQIGDFHSISDAEKLNFDIVYKASENTYIFLNDTFRSIDQIIDEYGFDGIMGIKKDIDGMFDEIKDILSNHNIL